MFRILDPSSKEYLSKTGGSIFQAHATLSFPWIATLLTFGLQKARTLHCTDDRVQLSQVACEIDEIVGSYRLQIQKLPRSRATKQRSRSTCLRTYLF